MPLIGLKGHHTGRGRGEGGGGEGAGETANRAWAS